MVKEIDEYTDKQKLASKIFNTIIGLIIIVVIAWVSITGMVYAFINHDQTESERFMNLWNAVTCQWHRDVYKENK